MRIYKPFVMMLSVLLVTGGSALAQSDANSLPTPQEAVSNPQEMAKLINALPEMTDQEAAKALADVMEIISKADMTTQQKQITLATYLSQGLVALPTARRGSMTAELIKLADNDTKLLVVSAGAMSNQELLENSSVLQAISGNDELKRAAEEPEATLGDSAEGVKIVLANYNILASRGIPQSDAEPLPTPEEAVNNPRELTRLINALPEMSDQDAAKALSDVMRVVSNDADMTTQQKRITLATYLSRGLVAMPMARRGSMTAELIKLADNDTKVLVVGAGALSNQQLLENSAFLQAISGNDELTRAAEEPDSTLGDSAQGVKVVLANYNILASRFMRQEDDGTMTIVSGTDDFDGLTTFASTTGTDGTGDTDTLNSDDGTDDVPDDLSDPNPNIPALPEAPGEEAEGTGSESEVEPPDTQAPPRTEPDFPQLPPPVPTPYAGQQ